MTSEPNTELRGRFDEVYQRYAQLREGVGQLQRDLEAVEATVRSPDGMVTVVVGPTGALKRVELHERAYQEHPPQRLAELITQASRHAATAVGRLVRARVGELAPEGTGIDKLLQRHDERMGYPNGT